MLALANLLVKTQFNKSGNNINNSYTQKYGNS